MINYQGKTTKQAVQQNAKQNTKQMEEETRKMEARLQELKLAMENERQQRTQSGNPGFWSRGQAGALTNYKSVSAGGRKPAPPTSGSPGPSSQSVRKVKLIKDEPLDLPERAPAGAVPGTLAHLARTSEAEIAQQQQQQRRAAGRGRGGGAAAATQPAGGAPRCGQCEDRPAAVLCPECAEEYCAKCFAAFHLKGALRKHRSLPLSAVTTPRQSLSNALATTPGAKVSSGSQKAAAGGADPSVFEDVSRQNRRDMVRQLLRDPDDRGSVAADASDGSGSLLSGRVDERENAAEFQRALAEWRSSGGGGGSSNQQPAARLQQPRQQQRQQQQHKTVSHATGTDDARNGVPGLEIKFTSSLTYAEQLLLQKHRRAEVGKMPGYRGGGVVGGGVAVPAAGASSSGMFEEIRSLQRQLTGMGEAADDDKSDERHQMLVALTNRTKVDDLFPDRTPRATEETPRHEPSSQGDEAEPRTPRPPTRSGAATPRLRQSRVGLEWQQQRPPSSSSETPRKDSARRQQPPHTPASARAARGRLTAAPSGELASVAALSRYVATIQQAQATFDAAAGGGFLLMGVDNRLQQLPQQQQRMPNVWSSGDSRPPSAASVTNSSSRPGSASTRLSNRFYALSGGRSWRPSAAVQPLSGLDPEQLRKTRAEADRLASTMFAATASGDNNAERMRLEDVEIEAETRVLSAMPLSRPVSARLERQKARAAAEAALSSRPGTAASSIIAPAVPRTSEELDVTADYLMDDVEHLSRLAVELAENSEDACNDAEKVAEAHDPKAATAATMLVGRELTQEDKEKQLQEWDDRDMDRMDTERYDDREEVRQLH